VNAALGDGFASARLSVLPTKRTLPFPAIQEKGSVMLSWMPFRLVYDITRQIGLAVTKTEIVLN
jgi:hypothetical protein